MRAKPFRIEIPEAKLEDLRRRLARPNLPPDFANDDWRYGTNGDALRELVDYWREDYDWRGSEKAMNAWPHYRAEVGGVPIHFARVRGVGPDPLPLILTHGWPWTFWDFRYVVDALSDPGAHGGDPADAFDVVVPSLPGFGFSTPLTRTGIHWARTADLWVELMRDVLGTGRFAAHGGDWGALVTAQLGHKHADAVVGIHVSGGAVLPAFDPDRPWAIGGALAQLARDAAAKEEALAWERKFASHVAVQMLDPQTLAYAMHDSPVGLLAWILERRRAWSDCGGDVERRFSKDHLLDTVMLYWLTDSFVTSVRYYWEAGRLRWKPAHGDSPVVQAPTGVSLFRRDMPPGSTDWMEDYYDLRLLRVRESGGHFAAAEEPEAIVADLRDLFRPLR